MKKIIFTLIVLATLVACQKNEPDSLFDKNPSERFEESQAELRKELTTAQQGWKLTYFTNDKKFGGFTFLMKFTPEGLVEMNSDMGLTSSSTTSKYEIQEGKGTMLVFTTKNYIHELSDAYTPTDLELNAKLLNNMYILNPLQQKIGIIYIIQQQMSHYL